MCSDESARTAETPPARDRESSETPAPARRSACDSETRPGCSSTRADSPAAVAPPHTACARSSDRLIPLASSARIAAYRGPGEPALQSADKLRKTACDLPGY